MQHQNSAAERRVSSNLDVSANPTSFDGLHHPTNRLLNGAIPLTLLQKVTNVAQHLSVSRNLGALQVAQWKAKTEQLTNFSPLWTLDF